MTTLGETVRWARGDMMMDVFEDVTQSAYTQMTIVRGNRAAKLISAGIIRHNDAPDRVLRYEVWERMSDFAAYNTIGSAQRHFPAHLSSRDILACDYSGSPQIVGITARAADKVSTPTISRSLVRTKGALASLLLLSDRGAISSAQLEKELDLGENVIEVVSELRRCELASVSKNTLMVTPLGRETAEKLRRLRKR